MLQSHQPTCTENTYGSATNVVVVCVSRNRRYLENINSYIPVQRRGGVGVGFNGILLQLSSRQVGNKELSQAWPIMYTDTQTRKTRKNCSGKVR